jgi:23S rRNA (uracil1939-C5)-methyltransferase
LSEQVTRRIAEEESFFEYHMSLRESFTITVERIVPGGCGLAFYEGRAVFVPLAVPGDRVLVREFKDRKSYLEVVDREVVQPSSERTSPPCPYFGSCGGCDFQQMAYDHQVTAKREILRDALRHIGKLEVPASQVRTHSSLALGYRNRLQLKLVHSPHGLSWGFYKAASHEVCGIDRCLIASPQLWQQLETLRRAIEAVPAICRQMDEADVFLGDDGDCLVDLTLLDAQPNLEALASEFYSGGELGEYSRLHVALSISSDPSRQSVPVSGDRFVWKTVGEFKYRVSHGSFFQVNDSMLPMLREVATKGYAGRRALELFCGVGFFTLPLAQKFEIVHAVEVNHTALSDLKCNLEVNDVPNVLMSEIDARSYFGNRNSLLREADLLLIDPPRAGLPREIIQVIAGLGVKEVVYVSCDPATLARDLRILRAHAYGIVSLELLDLFPQTHHLETVAHLKKG